MVYHLSTFLQSPLYLTLFHWPVCQTIWLVLRQEPCELLTFWLLWVSMNSTPMMEFRQFCVAWSLKSANAVNSSIKTNNLKIVVLFAIIIDRLWSNHCWTFWNEPWSTASTLIIHDESWKENYPLHWCIFSKPHNIMDLLWFIAVSQNLLFFK